jgi:4-amino-4-deoxy-L-arabinose transferase-like glycosyltransferase
VPDFDSGKHLLFAWDYRGHLSVGDLTEPFTAFTQYPPLTHVLGAIGTLIAGQNVAPAVLAAAVVFVPLLVLGLYRAGTLIGDRWTGALAVIFAIGTPMIITQSRAFMLELGLTALVAVSVWLLLASNRFEKVVPAAVAGVAVGLGMLTKQTFAFFIVGLVAVMVLRGGWRNVRGLVAFGLPVLLLAAPWYAVHWSDLRETSEWARGPNTEGPIWSAKNLSFYVWGALNRQFLLPLTLIALAGAVISSVRFLRRRDPHDHTPELLAGLAAGWAFLTFYLHLKSPYYALPLTVYAALLASGGIAAAGPAVRRVGAAALVLVAVVNLAVAGLWIGKPVRVALPGAYEPAPGAAVARHATFLSPEAWPATRPPGENGDLLDRMRTLKGRGVELLEFDVAVDLAHFNATGLTAFSHLAGIARPPVYDPEQLKAPREAFMGLQTTGAGQPPPCADLGDGTGVYVLLGAPSEGRRICPAAD